MLLHESLDALRAIADHDVPREAAQHVLNGLAETIGKVRAHDPGGTQSELVDAISAFEGAIRSIEEAMAVMNTGAEHIYQAANG